MPFEVGFVITATVLMIISNYLVQRANKKRKIMQIIASYLQLIVIGVNEEDALQHVIYKMRLSQTEVAEAFTLGKALETEASNAKFAMEVDRKVFAN